MNTNEKLQALRQEMQKRKIDAYIVPTSDYHESEYVGPYFKARAYLSGFTGSQGTLAVTLQESALWVDGRYFIQAEKQLAGSEIKMMKMGTPDTPTLLQWLNEKLPENGRLGFDGKVMNTALASQFSAACAPRNIALYTSEDLVDLIWEDRTALPHSEGFIVPFVSCGESCASKLARVRDKMREQQCDAHLITSLDDSAYLLNLRGDDIPHFPVLLSYLLITLEDAFLYVDPSKLDEDCQAYLQENGVSIRTYNQIYTDLSQLVYERMWLDETTVNYALGSCVPVQKRYNAFNPSQLMKACKNEMELESTRQAHLQDGAAMCKFLYWLKTNIGKMEITEISASDYLAQCRYEMGANDLSFDTISAYSDHAAMMHYSATPQSQYTLKPEGMLLVDSGGQYINGTTDVTRTIVLGPLSEPMKKHFTAALRSHIRLAKAVFLSGCGGMNLDILARGPLWDMGIDYRCGTGHGVGHLLNVHEGPNGFRWKIVPERKDSAVLQPGMLQSNEPGVYLEGEYGIRHENEMVVQVKETNEYGTFLQFETITFVPFDLDAIEVEMLTTSEKAWLNAYHAQVYDKISVYLDEDEKAWLKEATRNI